MFSQSLGQRAVRWVLVLTVLAGAEGCALLNGNFRTVEPQAFYRSGQLDPQHLERVIERHDIRTVINLRGEHPEEAWYREETAVCAAAGVEHHSLQWSKNRLPDPDSLAEFVRLCGEAERPVLVHCQGGTHRTGMASACYVLLEGGDVAEARRQFGLLFGDAYIGTLLDLYEGSPLAVDAWCLEAYPAIYAQASPTRPEPEDP